MKSRKAKTTTGTKVTSLKVSDSFVLGGTAYTISWIGKPEHRGMHWFVTVIVSSAAHGKEEMVFLSTDRVTKS